MTLDRFIDPAMLVGLAAALAPLGGFERRVFPPTARLLSAAADVFSLRLTEKKVVERLLGSTGSMLSEEGIEHYTNLFAKPQHVSAVLAMMAHWDLAPLFQDLVRLETPLLLVAGKGDRAVSLAHQELVLRRVSSAKLQVVGGVGHLLHEERPAMIAGLILREADLAIARELRLGLGAA
jgi:magnesium chelatase accessory protein